jgi:cytochrome c oxidase subunit 2
MTGKSVRAPRSRLSGIVGRLARPEWIAIGVAAVAFAIGPAAVLGYGRWESRDVITIHAVQWAYEPKTIYLTQGVPAHLRLISEDVTHGFAIDDLGIRVDDLLPGHAVDITVTPRQAGTYDFECTRYCGSRHGLMFGRIIVRPAQPPRQ